MPGVSGSACQAPFLRDISNWLIFGFSVGTGDHVGAIRAVPRILSFPGNSVILCIRSNVLCSIIGSPHIQHILFVQAMSCVVYTCLMFVSYSWALLVLCILQTF